MAERNVDLIIRARDEASKAFGSVNEALKNLEVIQKGVASGSVEMSASLKGATTDAKGLADAVAVKSKAAGDLAETSYRRVAKAVDTASQAFRRQEKDIHESRASFGALKAQLASAGKAVEKFKIQNEAAIDDRFKARLKAAQGGYRSLTREVAKAGASLATQERGLDESANSLHRLTGAAAAAEAALAELHRRQRHAVASVSADEQARLAKEFRAAAAAGKITVEQQQRLAASFRQASAAAKGFRVPLKQVIGDLTFMGPAAGRAADGLRRNAGELTNARRALRAFYGDSRRALSLMQRLRGEVLSLTASFVGFYGVFRAGQSILESFTIVQAAQNRLSAAFGQNAGAVGAEMDFLNSEAARLGISFGVLADSYSKFLISGQQAGIETDKLRKVFRQVTEAGRVLNLSNEQIEGTLTALSQIAGKGTLQMEELRQQLGDRLPGAVGLVAKSLGYAKDELAQFYKDVENGAVDSESALVALGQGLEDIYGDQLAEALESTATKIGQFQDLLFQRSLTAGNSGFIDGLERALDALNGFLESDDGVQFFENLGAAFGEIFKLLPGIVANLDKFVLAFKLFIALKAAQVASGLAGNFHRMIAPTEASRQALLRFNASLYQVSPAAYSAMAASTRLGMVLRGLRGALFGVVTGVRAVVASVGGPIGIAIAALSYFAMDGLGEVDEATQKLDKTLRTHEEQMAKIRAAYLRAKGGADDWKDSLEGLTEIEVEAQLGRLREELENYRNSLEHTLNTMKGNAPEVRAQLKNHGKNPAERQMIQDLLDADAAFNKAEISAKDYKDAIVAFKKAAPDLLPVGFLELLIKVANGGLEIEEAIAEAEAAIGLFGDTASEADKDILGLSDSTDEAAKKGAEAAAAYEGFAGAMRKLAEQVPSLKAELDRFDAIGEIAADFEAALAAAQKLPEAMRLMAQAKARFVRDQATDELYAGSVGDYSGTDGTEVSAQFLRDREGFLNTPRWDVNAMRGGYGSDTVTLEDGTIKKITEGMYISVADANRDLIRRIETEFRPAARNAVGADKFDTLNAQQQTALTSLAYNYGAGAFDEGESLAGVAQAVREGSVEGVAQAIKDLGDHNGGVNKGRRNMEAALFSANIGEGDAVKAEEKRVEEALKNEEKRLKLISDYNEKVRLQIENSEFELSIQQKGLQDREVAKALREAELEAQKAGTELTKEQAALLEKNVRAQYAQQAADEDREAKLEKAKELEEAILLLQERRRFVQDRIEQLANNGDMVGSANAEEELASIDERLDSAIEKALEFWKALGGEGSEAALQNLEFAKEELKNIENQVVTTGKQMNEFFAQTASAAIDRFAKRVADGENVLKAFASEFRQMAAEILIQIGQMIVKQAIFNMISGMFGGGASGSGGLGGSVAGLINGLFHGGGIAGGASQTRTTNPALFANALRYHTGGIAGFAPDEVGAVLKKNEEVLTESDPRHRFNGGRVGQGGDGGLGGKMLKIINAIDAVGFLEAALASDQGADVFVNHIRANQDEVKQAMG